MKNSEKTELRKDVRELAKKGYSQREAINILVEWGYTQTTARSYWKVFAPKYQEQLKQEARK